MIPDKIPKQEYTDLNGKVLFPFSFDVVTSDSVKVEITESGQESGTIVDPTSYTVEIPSSGSAPAAGNVRFHEPLSIQGGTMTIFRQTEFSQESELGNGSQFYPKVVESALDKLTMIAQELKGGVVTTRQGESYGYAESAGVADGLKEGAVVDSAEHAQIAEYASSFAEGATIENAEHAARATVAESATTANIAGGLTPLAKADIIASAGDGGSVLLGAKAYAVMPNMQGGEQIFSASGNKSSTFTTSSGTVGALGNGYGGVLILHGELNDGYDSSDGFKMTNLTGYGSAINVVDPESCGEGGGGAASSVYTGPFALATDGSGNGMTAGMNSGYVWAGGSQYLISAFSNDHVSFPDGSTLYLTLLSSGGAISSGLVTDTSGETSDTVLVRIASRASDSDDTEQLQFGDITTVPWGLGGGGGVMLFPKYEKLTEGAYTDVYSSGESIGSSSNLAYPNLGSTYYAMDNGYLRISLKNALATGLGCLKLNINGNEIGLFDVQSAADISHLRGVTLPAIPISKGTAFSVYTLNNMAVGEVLVKFDHNVSITALAPDNI